MNNGVGTVMVANRTYERAVELAKEFDGARCDYEDLVVGDGQRGHHL